MSWDNIDWNAVSDIIRFPEQAQWRAAQRAANAPQDATGAPSTPTEAAAASVPAPTEPSAPTATHVPVERSAASKATVTRKPDPVAELSAALDAAGTDEERSALLAAAPRKVRERLNATLTYRKLVSDADNPYAAFTSALDAAPDDDARRALIAAARRDPKRGAAFLSEWTWRRTATADDARRRYLAMIGGGSTGETLT